MVFSTTCALAQRHEREEINKTKIIQNYPRVMLASAEVV